MLYAFYSNAQGSAEYQAGIKLHINGDSSRFIRFITWYQIGVRSQEKKPGTLINGEVTNNSWDIGARRQRMLAYVQISPRYLIVTHFGINNQNFATGGGSGIGGT